jgi:phosphotransferase system enzyme I (PtsI)
MLPKGENILHGIPAAPGIRIGEAYLYLRDIERVNEETIDDVDEAIENLLFALEKSKKELKKIFNLAVDKLGSKRAAIFEAQIMILDDPILIKRIIERIKTEKKSSDFIVDDEISKYQKMMIDSNERYMTERSQDIEDIKNRIIRNIRRKKWVSRITDGAIIVAESISPADAVLFNRVNAKGYVTDFGGLTSHAAIVARSLDIPAVLGASEATININTGDNLIVDGFNGIVVVNPTDEQLKYFNEKIKKLSEFDEELAKVKELPAETIDNHKVKLMGNLDFINELEVLINNGAEGIGLIRTEQLFDGLDEFPDEEQQFQIFKRIAESMYPNEIVIRTFDIGGDKVLPFDVKEDNPFLGWRGVRFLLDNLQLLKPQIKAILRAAVTKNVKMMVPMITSIKEVRRVKEIVNECRKELEIEGKECCKKSDFGIMIEVPSAVYIADDLSKEVGFFSIGTNDLIQYTLAVDRGNEIISSLYQEFHPSIIRSLKKVIDDGKANGIEVSICGEMAGDPIAVPILIGLGIDALSVSSYSLPRIKKIIRGIEFSVAKTLADKCLKLETEEEIQELVKKFYSNHFYDDVSQIFEDINDNNRTD